MMLAFGIFITHGIAGYVAIDLVWTKYVVAKLNVDSRKLLWEYVVRTLIVLFTCKLPLFLQSRTFCFLSFELKMCFSLCFLRLLWRDSFHSAVLLAVAVPNLEHFISLVGALCLSSLGLAFPALFELCVFLKHTRGFCRYVMIVKNIIIGLVGLAGFLIGTTTSLTAIVQTFSK